MSGDSVGLRRAAESLPELIPFNQQVHQVFSDARPRAPRIYRFRARMARGAGWLAPPSPFRPLSRRSGRFPALPCPPLRYLHLKPGLWSRRRIYTLLLTRASRAAFYRARTELKEHENEVKPTHGA
jgi:hypothetical protein